MVRFPEKMKIPWVMTSKETPGTATEDEAAGIQRQTLNEL